MTPTPDPLDLPALCADLLNATRDQATTVARTTRLRKAVQTAARTLVGDVGGFTRKVDGLGAVTVGQVGPWLPAITDADAFAGWAAEHAPDLVRAAIVLPPAHLEDALDALASLDPALTPGRDVVARLELVDDAGDWLEGCAAVDPDDTGTVLVPDAVTGEAVPAPGLTGTRRPGRLVVTLARDVRAAAEQEGTR